MRISSNSVAAKFSFLQFSKIFFILCFLAPTGAFAQIVFDHDTTLTGFHNFTQNVKIMDSTVTLYIEGANINFHGGLTIEYGDLFVTGSTLYFFNGSGLVVSNNGEFYNSSESNYRGSSTEPAYVTLLNSKANVSHGIFEDVRVFTSGKAWWIPPNTPAYNFYQCQFSLGIDNSNPMFEGNHFYLTENYFSRWNDTITVSQSEYYNISIAGQFGKVENCISNYGGIESPWATSQNLEIINNSIRNAKVGIYSIGVKTIAYNLIENVETGIEGGTIYTRLNNVYIANNQILNVTGQAIDVVGDSIIIHKNIIKGNGQTAKGIDFENSSGWITNNLISDFKISEASYSDDGIGLFLNAPYPGQFRKVVVNGNIFEYCGLSETADPEIVSSIVHIKSPVIFTHNEMRLNTLGGQAANLYNFAGGPVLNIEVPGNLDPPVIVNNNFIHSNTFVNSGVYEPTQTKGTLVAIELQNRKLEFKGNMLYGSPDATLGVYLYPGGFPGGVVGDSLIFEQNTIVNNYVGVGTMAGPDLSHENNFKDNTNYHIMRYGGQRDQEMFAQFNNWDSSDPAVIDNKLYDDDEESSTGPINFTGYYSVTYYVTPQDPGSQQLNQGDSLEITIRVTDPQGTPIENVPGFFTSSDGNVARITTENPLTGSDGYLTGTLHAYEDGSTNVTVYAGGSVSDPIQVTVGEVGVDNEPTDISFENYKLYQNYPNPFNPGTKIRFEIPVQDRNDNAFVTLRIYDVLGNEVATIVNEEKPTGEYEVEFGSSAGIRHLASGIYFYRLKAGSFVQTKKMLLLK